MATSPATITPLTNAPSTSSPSDFDARADALLGVGLPLLVTEVNAANIVTYNNAVEAKASADAAAVSATATGATRWISGTSYALFTIVYSPLNYQAYRKITATGATTTDPSLDATNWVSVSPISVSTAAATYVPLTGTLGSNGINLGSGGFRVTNAYYLGVGTATPLTTAHIYSGNANPLMVTRASNVVVNGASGTTIDIGALNGTTAVTAGQVGTVLNNPATTGIMYFTTLSAGTLTEKMRIDNSGNVGIGGTPTSKLHVFGTFRQNDATNSFGYIATTASNKNTFAAIAGSGYFAWQVDNSGVDALTLDANGKVGIGVDPVSGGRLNVNGNVTLLSNGRLGYLAETDTGTVSGATVAHYGINFGTTFTGFSGQGTGIGGYYGILLHTSGTERMRIDSSGNVGVGTTSGGGKLEVAGNYASFLDATRTNFLSISPGASSVLNSSGVMQFNTAGTERMRIDSSGNVLIGTTGTGPLNSNSISFSPTVTGGADFNHITGTATATMYSRFNLAGTTIGSITQSGTTAVLYNTTSDARLKTNVEPAADTGTLLDAVQVRQFDWISDGTHQRYGFVAQELVEVVPEAVHQPAEPEQMMAVDYSKLVPLLVKEIQSLRARLAKLESQI